MHFLLNKMIFLKKTDRPDNLMDCLVIGYVDISTSLADPFLKKFIIFNKNTI